MAKILVTADDNSFIHLELVTLQDEDGDDYYTGTCSYCFATVQDMTHHFYNFEDTMQHVTMHIDRHNEQDANSKAAAIILKD